MSLTTERLTPEQIGEILAKHLKWLHGEDGGQRANLYRANLSRANLSEADLSEADLSEADLSEADLSEADLSEANLYRADLTEANLFAADLTEANLTEANLTEADLSRANLTEADLSRANLYRADLSYYILQIGPIGSRNDYLIYKTGIDEIKTGCFTGTLAEFEAAVEETHGDTKYGQQYRKAVEFLKAFVFDKEPVA